MKDAILGVNPGKYNTVPETNMQENLKSVAKKNDKKKKKSIQNVKTKGKKTKTKTKLDCRIEP